MDRSDPPRFSAQVFAPSVDADPPPLLPDDVHHLRNVLRLEPPEMVVVGDGKGRLRPYEVVRGPEFLRACGSVHEVPKVEPEVAVGFVPVKAERPEWVVQKLTELGVDRIAVVRSQRSVVRWEGERKAKAMQRLRRVAREAAAQSRRAWLPEISGVSSLGEILACSKHWPEPVCLAEPGAAPLGSKASIPLVLVGPEGGWAPSEIESVGSTVSLGSGILRAETAAVAAGVLLCAIRDGWKGPGLDAPARGSLTGRKTGG